MKKKLRVCFIDWFDDVLPGSSSDNIFIFLLKQNYDIIIDYNNPDVLFYGLLHNNHLKYKNCLKIFVCAEPGFWNIEDLTKYFKNDRTYISIKDADYLFLSYNIKEKSDNYYYFPIFLIWLYHHVYITKIINSFDSLTKSRNFNKYDIKYRKFCCFLHLNNNPKKRREMFFLVSKYKNVDSNLYNKNIDIVKYNDVNGGSIGKINFIKNYKFTFAFQNHYYKEHETYKIPGFIDEKLIESLLSNTIPLYYGNDKISDFFNTNSFLNWHDYENDEIYLNKIIELDNDDDLFLQYLNNPVLKSVEHLGLSDLSNFLKKIIN